MKVVHRYALVRVVAFILKLLAWLILILCIVGAIAGGTLIGRPPDVFPPGWFGAGAVVVSLLTGIFWFVPFYALGSVLTLLLDIEENTRALAGMPGTYETSQQPQV